MECNIKMRRTHFSKQDKNKELSFVYAGLRAPIDLHNQ